jgi:hypothetical protein
MSTKANQSTSINRAAVAAVAKGLADGYGAAANTAGIVTQCVTLARKFYKGKDIPAQDMEAIVDKVSVARAWTKVSMRSRKTEARNILAQYNVLPEVIKAFTKKTGGCTWHNVVELSRELGRSKGKVAPAVAALVKRKAVNHTPPGKLTKTQSKVKAATAINGVLKLNKLDPDFLRKLVRLGEDYGLKVKIPTTSKKKGK